MLIIVSRFAVLVETRDCNWRRLIKCGLSSESPDAARYFLAKDSTLNETSISTSQTLVSIELLQLSPCCQLGLVNDRIAPNDCPRSTVPNPVMMHGPWPVARADRYVLLTVYPIMHTVNVGYGTFDETTSWTLNFPRRLLNFPHIPLAER